MTREEAIKVLNKDLQIIDDPKVTMTAREWEEHDDNMRDALEIAIKAIEQEPKRGKWRKRKIKEHQFIQNGYELYYCSECYKNYSNTVGVEGFDYCPNCGARMESEEE